MSTGAALLILGVAAALALAVQSSCHSLIHCPCGRSGGNIKVCVQENSATEDPCRKWAGCKKCQDGLDGCLECPDGFEGPFCEKDALQKTKIRRKREYYPYTDYDDYHHHYHHHQDAPSNTGVFQNAPTWAAAQQGERCTCEDPGFISHGYRKSMDGTQSTQPRTFWKEESVVYGCRYRDYALRGPAILTCMKDGNWSERKPECIKSTAALASEMVYCRDPGVVANGLRNPVSAPSHRGFPQGSSLQYTCNENYDRNGERQIYCLTSGKWSSPAPTCVEQSGDDWVYCLNPGSIENGKFTYLQHINGRSQSTPEDPEYPEGARLEYSCNSGYALRGSSILTCGETGEWSSGPPTCSPGPSSYTIRYCKNPGPITNGKLLHNPSLNGRRSQGSDPEDEEFSAGSLLEYSCDVGYTLQGKKTLICTSSGSWSATPPTCITGNRMGVDQ